MFLKYEITQTDITREQEETQQLRDQQIFLIPLFLQHSKNNNYIPLPTTILSVVSVFPFDNAASNNMFDIKYQMRLNDLYDFSSTSMIHYEMTMQHLDYLSHILVGQNRVRFSEHQQRLYIDIDWESGLNIRSNIY